MSVANTITVLRDMGYVVGLEPGDKIRLSWQGHEKPNKDKILPLIEHLKAHKREAVVLLSTGANITPHPIPSALSTPALLVAIFQETFDDLNRRCIQGLLWGANFSMLAQVQESQARIDKTWKECLEGKASL
ncbi:MAG TPA: hypothetical protein ACFYD1_00600, partial [Candidatus Hypogeohydataceae bacterium YC38]